MTSKINCCSMILPDIFPYKIINNTDEIFEIRTSALTADEAKAWLDEYSGLTNTNWIVKDGVYEPQRLILHKKFVCRHAKKNKRKSDSKRNTNCAAYLDIKIKKINRGTKKNDPCLKLATPLPCIIKGSITHNHTINTCGSLKFLRMNEATKQKFIRFFDDGLGAAESIKQYVNKFLINVPNWAELMANARINPTYNMVKHLFDNWRAKHFGQVTDSILKIKEKVAYYKKYDIIVRIHEDYPWSILVVTPTMRRAQELNEASEIIFIDSTCSVDVNHSTLTVVLTASKAGAIPICFIVHQGQSEESYVNAFSQVKEFSLTAFGGKECPLAFMTDDSTAEKNALRLVWPQSRQLLCHFHVAQAEWRWLMATKNNISPQQRQDIMKKFKAIMYSSSKKEYDKYIEELMSETDIKYQNRLSESLKTAEEWVLFHRNNVITRGHNTNNYSEATMRIMKDIILQRTKAFNPVALVDYCSTIWEDYIKKRILNFANGRKDTSFLKLRMLQKIENYNVDKICKKDSATFLIPSCTSSNVYTVNTNIGICSCASGLQGAFCKHQYLIHKNYGPLLPNAPPLEPGDKLLLAQLALGKHYPDIEFYRDLKLVDMNNLHNDSVSSNNCLLASKVSKPTPFLSPVNNNNEQLCDSEIFEKNIENISLQLQRISNLLPNNEIVNKHLIILEQKMGKIDNDQHAINFLIDVSKCLKRKKGGAIKVQPTSIARRRKHTSRGCKRVSAGRPALVVARKRRKRPHNLSKNIKENQPNGIIHGVGH